MRFSVKTQALPFNVFVTLGNLLNWTLDSSTVRQYGLLHFIWLIQGLTDYKYEKTLPQNKALYKCWLALVLSLLWCATQVVWEVRAGRTTLRLQ